MKRSHVAWLAVVVPTWLVLILCTHWEPILRDGWGHLQWHRTFAVTPSTVWDFAHESYIHNNPRFGQVLTMLVYTPGPWHSIITPLVEMAMFYLLALLALGRRPSIERTGDALVFLTLVGMIGLTAPLVGQMLFYRPFTGNYLFGFTIALACFAPFRLHAETPTPRRWWWIPIMVVLGFCAGLSNEHTGPTLVVVAMFAIAAFIKRGERPALWMIAGLVGLVAGGLALYYAPGQAIRYNGLAGSTSLVGRVFDRTLLSNVKIVLRAFGGTALLLPWAALASIAWLRDTPVERSRAQLVSAIAMLVAAFMITATLLVSPKQGGRLDFASICLACAAFTGFIAPLLRPRAIAWLFAIASSAYLLLMCLKTYHQVGEEFAVRFEAIESAPEHGVVTVTPYTVPRSRWFLGEDFGADGLRFGIAWNRKLQGVVLERPAEVPDEQGGL